MPIKDKLQISERLISELERSGMNQVQIANFFGCAHGTIVKIKSGVRSNRLKKGAKPEKNRMCTACGIEPVLPGNRFLGQHCYTGNKNHFDYDYLEAT